MTRSTLKQIVAIVGAIFATTGVLATIFGTVQIQDWLNVGRHITNFLLARIELLLIAVLIASALFIILVIQYQIMRSIFSDKGIHDWVKFEGLFFLIKYNKHTGEITIEKTVCGICKGRLTHLTHEDDKSDPELVEVFVYCENTHKISTSRFYNPEKMFTIYKTETQSKFIDWFIKEKTSKYLHWQEITRLKTNGL